MAVWMLVSLALSLLVVLACADHVYGTTMTSFLGSYTLIVCIVSAVIVIVATARMIKHRDRARYEKYGVGKNPDL